VRGANGHKDFSGGWNGMMRERETSTSEKGRERERKGEKGRERERKGERGGDKGDKLPTPFH
jgi:hypothetical protein